VARGAATHGQQRRGGQQRPPRAVRGRCGRAISFRRRRVGATEALDDENDADLFDTWADAPKNAALASVSKLWAVLIKYTMRCCTRTLTTKRERMGKRAQ